MTNRAARAVDVSIESQRRQQIARAVMDCIAEDGLERTTMRNVAGRAGVSTGTLAYYFKSKKDLVDAALLDASREFMARFYQKELPDGPEALEQLIERFLSPANADAGFVLQMIEVGLHNSELRGTHQEMVEAGRRMIENCLRFGIQTGQYRSDLDPELAAALMHGVLIWWGSELLWNATSQDLATDVSRLLLHLLETQSSAAIRQESAGENDERSAFPTVDHVRSVLMADTNLTRNKARRLAQAFEKMYSIAADAD